MVARFGSVLLFFAAAAWASLIGDVRSSIAQNDFARAETLIEQHKKANGVTPEMLEAYSWLGRGALASKRLDDAEKYADTTKRMALEQMKKVPLESEKHLPIALGAAIEVKAQVLAARGERDEAVRYLRDEVERYRSTTIVRTRTQKNLNLLSLEGKPAPALDLKESVGPKPQALYALLGKPVLLFFWAHWCPDCKQQGPVLARLMRDFGAKGLTIVGPTQRYGYAERGRDVGPAEELKYIEDIRKQFYGMLPAMAVPVSEETFRLYGASTTPTLVLVDRKGVVAMYRPGQMKYEELAARIAAVL